MDSPKSAQIEWFGLSFTGTFFVGPVVFRPAGGLALFGSAQPIF